MGDPSGYRLLDDGVDAGPEADGRRDSYLAQRDGHVDGIVVRVTAVPAGTTADAWADRCLDPAVAGSVHAVTGADGVVPMLPDDHVALATGASDDTSLVLEILWTSAEPDDDDALVHAATWCAERIGPHAIAVRRCSVEQWEAGRSGLIGADELGVGDRVVAFPWDEFLDEIRRAPPRRRAVAAWWRGRDRPARAVVMAVAATVLIAAGVVAVALVTGDEPDDEGGDAGGTPTAVAPTVAPGVTSPAAESTTRATTEPVPTTVGTSVDGSTTSSAANVVPVDAPTTAGTTTEPAPTTSTPTTSTPTNLSGPWIIEVDVVEADRSCAQEVGEPPYVRTVFVFHEGADVAVVGLGDGDEAWEGTFDGEELAFGGDRDEDGGLTTARFSLVLDEAGALRGEEIWGWVGGGLSCPNGRSVVIGLRDVEGDPVGIVLGLLHEWSGRAGTG